MAHRPSSHDLVSPFVLSRLDVVMRSCLWPRKCGLHSAGLGQRALIVYVRETGVTTVRTLRTKHADCVLRIDTSYGADCFNMSDATPRKTVLLIRPLLNERRKDAGNAA